MQTNHPCLCKTALAALLTCFALNVLADDATGAGGPPLAISYVRMYVDDQDMSHFGDAELPLAFEDYAPPANPIAVHAIQNVDGATLIQIAGGVFENWHPAPRRQFAFILQGVVEVTVGDGEARRFSPGDVVLLEDTTGRGHTTRVVSEEDHIALMMPVLQGP